MAEYLVTWTINVEAETNEEAAQQAWEAVRAPDSEATIFEVQRKGRRHFDGFPMFGDKVEIDVATL